MRYANLFLLLALTTSPLAAQFQILRPAAKPAEKETAEQPAAEAEAAGEADKTAQPATAKEPRNRQQERVVYNSSGQRQPTGVSEERTVDGDKKSLVQRVRSINGRTVPYLTEKEQVLSESDGLKVSERVRQRYDATGRPASQETERIEKRKLADGTTETTTTIYTSDLNGRPQPSQRIIVRETRVGNETHTSETTQAPGMSGQFRTVAEMESVERRDGEKAGTIETTRKTLQGTGGLQVSSREETVMRMENGVAVTETQKFERSPATNALALSTKTVGKLVERPNGASTETVETYGFKAGSGINLNATRMELQSVATSESTVAADGTIRERISYKERSAADPREFGAATVTQKVSKPTGDGESVRTDVYERGVNGRMAATESVVEKIER